MLRLNNLNIFYFLSLLSLLNLAIPGHAIAGHRQIPFRIPGLPFAREEHLDPSLFTVINDNYESRVYYNGELVLRKYWETSDDRGYLERELSAAKTKAEDVMIRTEDGHFPHFVSRPTEAEMDNHIEFESARSYDALLRKYDTLKQETNARKAFKVMTFTGGFQQSGAYDLLNRAKVSDRNTPKVSPRILGILSAASACVSGWSSDRAK